MAKRPKGSGLPRGSAALRTMRGVKHPVGYKFPPFTAAEVRKILKACGASLRAPSADRLDPAQFAAEWLSAILWDYQFLSLPDGERPPSVGERRAWLQQVEAAAGYLIELLGGRAAGDFGLVAPAYAAQGLAPDGDPQIGHAADALELLDPPPTQAGSPPRHQEDALAWCVAPMAAPFTLGDPRLVARAFGGVQALQALARRACAALPAGPARSRPGATGLDAIGQELFEVFRAVCPDAPRITRPRGGGGHDSDDPPSGPFATFCDAFFVAAEWRLPGTLQLQENHPDKWTVFRAMKIEAEGLHRPRRSRPDRS